PAPERRVETGDGREQDEEGGAALPGARDRSRGRGTARAAVGEGQRHDDPLPRRDRPARQLSRPGVLWLPDGVELEVERELLDRSLPVRKGEVVVEDIAVPLLEQDSRERVGDLVVDLGLREGRVGGAAASPPQRLRVFPPVTVHFREVSLCEGRLLARRGV